MSSTTTTRTVLTVVCFVICTFSFTNASLCVCNGKHLQADGSLVFDIAPTISNILQKSSCEGQLVTDGKVRVQYGYGRMENFTDPVKSASVYMFTVDESASAYIYIIAECPQDNIFINETCIYLQTDQDDPDPQGRHHIITVMVTLAFFTLAIIIIIAIALRKKCVFTSCRGHNESSFICSKLQTV